MSAQSGVSEKTSNETSTKPKDIWTRVLEWNHEKSSPSQFICQFNNFALFLTFFCYYHTTTIINGFLKNFN